VHLTPKFFFTKIIKLILWSNLPQKFLDLVKSLRKNLCCKKASTLQQSKRPDWDSQSIHFGFDVTALTLPRFPMCSREPFKTRFRRGTEIHGFNQIEKFLWQITPQNKLYYFSEKKFFGVRCTLR